MAGELTPLVLLPRYTTYTGAHDFTTIGMEVTDYSKAIVNFWRGDLAGGGSITVTYEESTDQNSWSTCTTGGPYNPSAGSEVQHQPELNKRWFRIKVTLTGTNPYVTCWAIGFLELREA